MPLRHGRRSGLEAFSDAFRHLAFPLLVYTTGVVCISILHPPGDDPNGYEHASERWSPVQTVSTILLSISAQPFNFLAFPHERVVSSSSLVRLTAA